MPSQNMLPKGKRRQTVKPAYRAHREAQREAAEAARQQEESSLYEATPAEHVRPPEAREAIEAPARPVITAPVLAAKDGLRSGTIDSTARGMRLDAYLAKALPEISRARAQLLIEQGDVRINGVAGKASYKLLGGERLEIAGEPRPAPLKAEPEDIPLTVVYEDKDLAVIDKPAGMTVHAGAGDAEHNRGTLVNALLFHFGQQLSSEGGELRPGIVHRLDKDTSGLMLVAKNDPTHRKLAAMFSERTLDKVYLALVHGTVAKEAGTIDLPIGRDPVRRTRMTARRGVESGARPAITHWRVLERIGSREHPGPLGNFTLVEVHIETGRTHQIRVHLAALGYPVVGDTLYGAPGTLKRGPSVPAGEPTLERNFLHAAELRLRHPRSRKAMNLRAPLPPLLEEFLSRIRGNEVASDRA